MVPRVAAAAALLCAFLGSCARGSLVLPADGPGRTSNKTEGPCTLAGTWVNELGSQMVLSASNAAGHFSGSYLTAVSASEKPIRASKLKGSHHQTNRRAQPTFGFTVQWAFSDSTTVFVGQCFVDASGQETLETTWLLQEEVASRADAWKATRIGKNVFHRVK
ncbi:avidin-like [Hemicordylus capensis]|uniref:avidin-like n=1 Tax=Hemicordylus capensis TaxID=884348 RepID=UPI0023033C3B|nr:avidin-like [Hemicordylus capensis]